MNQTEKIKIREDFNNLISKKEDEGFHIINNILIKKNLTVEGLNIKVFFCKDGKNKDILIPLIEMEEIEDKLINNNESIAYTIDEVIDIVIEKLETLPILKNPHIKEIEIFIDNEFEEPLIQINLNTDMKYPDDGDEYHEFFKIQGDMVDYIFEEMEKNKREFFIFEDAVNISVKECD